VFVRPTNSGNYSKYQYDTYKKLNPRPLKNKQVHQMQYNIKAHPTSRGKQNIPHPPATHSTTSTVNAPFNIPITALETSTSQLSSYCTSNDIANGVGARYDGTKSKATEEKGVNT
jgi:hypothetical protein